MNEESIYTPISERVFPTRQQEKRSQPAPINQHIEPRKHGAPCPHGFATAEDILYWIDRNPGRNVICDGCHACYLEVEAWEESRKRASAEARPK